MRHGVVCLQESLAYQILVALMICTNYPFLVTEKICSQLKDSILSHQIPVFDLWSSFSSLECVMIVHRSHGGMKKVWEGLSVGWTKQSATIDL